MVARMPARRSISVFCDETGTHQCKYFAWGSIWCPSGRCEEFRADFEQIWAKYRLDRELGWKFSHGSQRLKRELITYFFSKPWLCFQSFFVRKSDMYIFSGRKASRSLAFKKLLCTMIATQAAHFDSLPGGPRQFRVIVDRVGQGRKATAKEYQVISASLAKRGLLARAPLASFQRVDSRSSRAIQLADLMVGAIRAAWEYPPGCTPKAAHRDIQTTIANHLGWPDLLACTPRNLKFNIWLHQDSNAFDLRAPRFKIRSGDPARFFPGYH